MAVDKVAAPPDFLKMSCLVPFIACTTYLFTWFVSGASFRIVVTNAEVRFLQLLPADMDDKHSAAVVLQL